MSPDNMIPVVTRVSEMSAFRIVVLIPERETSMVVCEPVIRFELTANSRFSKRGQLSND